MYFPTIPKHNNCIPPIKRIIQTNEGHPEVGSLKINVLTTMRIIAIIEAKHENAPTNEARFKGASEKLTIPSIEYLNRLQNDQDV